MTWQLPLHLQVAPFTRELTDPFLTPNGPVFLRWRCRLLREARRLTARALPFPERAGFRAGCADWPVVAEEEQDAHREERAAGGAGGAHPGGGEQRAEASPSAGEAPAGPRGGRHGVPFAEALRGAHGSPEPSAACSEVAPDAARCLPAARCSPWLLPTVQRGRRGRGPLSRS